MSRWNHLAEPFFEALRAGFPCTVCGNYRIPAGQWRDLIALGFLASVLDALSEAVVVTDVGSAAHVRRLVLLDRLPCYCEDHLDVFWDVVEAAWADDLTTWSQEMGAAS